MAMSSEDKAGTCAAIAGTILCLGLVFGIITFVEFVFQQAALDISVVEYHAARGF